MHSFGERLRILRKNKKITQKELANLFKISESAVGMYERDEREPSFELIRNLADFFEVSTDYILGRTNDKKLKNDDNETANFEDMLDDPEFEIFYKELKGSPEENRRKALDFLKYLNEQDKK